MTCELLWKLQRCMTFLILVTLPLNGIPKRFVIPGLGNNLSAYFMLIAAVLVVYEYFRFGFKIPRNLKIFFLIYIGWQIICLVKGLFCYEFNYLLTLEQIPKLGYILNRLSVYGIAVPELIAIKLWLFLKATRDIVLSNDIFFMAFYMYHVYYNKFSVAMRDVQKAIIVLVVIMGLYSGVELIWLKTNSVWAENILKGINVYLYDPKVNHGWHPPLLWANQLSSICLEPSYFGLLGALILPFLWINFIYVKKCFKKFATGSLLLYFLIMIFATNARTAVILSGMEGLLLIITIFFVREKTYTINILVVVFITVCSYGVNLWSDSFKNNVSTDKYIKSNVISVLESGARSNNARFTSLLANINVIKKYPVMGVGTSLKDAYIDVNIPKGRKTGEIALWSTQMKEKGVLKSGYPSLNKFADVAVLNGVVGLLLYMCVPFHLFYLVCVKWGYITSQKQIFILMICMVTLLIAQLSNSLMLVSNGIVYGLLYLKLLGEKMVYDES